LRDTSIQTRRDAFRPLESESLEGGATDRSVAWHWAFPGCRIRDGAAGRRRLRRAGGVTLAQDEATSVVFGVPIKAVRLEPAEHVLAPDGIVRFIRAVAGRREAR